MWPWESSDSRLEPVGSCRKHTLCPLGGHRSAVASGPGEVQAQCWGLLQCLKRCQTSEFYVKSPNVQACQIIILQAKLKKGLAVEFLFPLPGWRDAGSASNAWAWSAKETVLEKRHRTPDAQGDTRCYGSLRSIITASYRVLSLPQKPFVLQPVIPPSPTPLNPGRPKTFSLAP